MSEWGPIEPQLPKPRRLPTAQWLLNKAEAEVRSANMLLWGEGGGVGELPPSAPTRPGALGVSWLGRVVLGCMVCPDSLCCAQCSLAGGRRHMVELIRLQGARPTAPFDRKIFLLRIAMSFLQDVAG